LLFAVGGVVVREGEPEHESRQHGVRVGLIAQPHEQEEAGEDELDLRLDHPVAVATEEPRRQARQANDEQRGDADEGEYPEVRLDEEDRERSGGAEVGHEGGGRDPLADHRLVEPSLDQHGVDDGEARSR
jgi:hypothetical protein